MAAKKIGVSAFFVYGTLKPDGLYWPRIESLVAYYEPAQVKGQVFDTGLGYPAAIFGGDDLIEGVLLYVAEPNAALVTSIMDAIEEEGREYRRIEVATVDGVWAWAYEWALDTAMLKPIEDF